MWPLPSTRTLVVLGGALLLAALGVVAPLLLGVSVAVDVLLVTLIAWDWLNRPGLEAVTVSRVVPERVPLGEPASIGWWISTKGPALRTVALRDTWPVALGGEPSATGRDIEPGVPRLLEAHALPSQRGAFALGDVELRLTHGPGLWIHRRRFPSPGTLRVVPAVAVGGAALRQLERIGAGGERRTRQRGLGMEFDALRPYRVGDALRVVDWKATARVHRPISRSYSVERNHDVLLVVDTGRLMGARSGGRSKLDHVVDAALALAFAGVRVGDRVGLVAFDRDVREAVPPGRGPGHLGRVMDRAADLQPRADETDFVTVATWLGAHHRKRTLLVFFTDFVDRLTAEPMVAAILTLGRRHPCLFVAVEDPEIGDTLAAPPASLGAVHEKAVAYALDLERRTVLETLRRAGVTVVGTRPEGLVAPTLNAFLELRLAAWR